MSEDPGETVEVMAGFAVDPLTALVPGEAAEVVTENTSMAKDMI